MAKNDIKKIAIIGAESTGKTWLCEALARHYQTVWVPEYAREYFNDSGLYNFTLDDLVIIAAQQIALEEALMKKAVNFLFCDTTLITLKIWAEVEFNEVPLFIGEQLLKIKYDHYFITNNEIAWQADALRENKHSRNLLFEMNAEAVKRIGGSYSVIKGTEGDRLKSALTIVESLRR